MTITRLRRRSTASLAVFIIGLLTATLGIFAINSTSADAAVKPTVVSLTFDDGNADQTAALAPMASAGLKGTFYIITGSIDTPNYLTRANLTTIAQAGNEIAGHTVNHPMLTQVPIAEATRQICTARNTLTSWGFPQTSFAYPFTDVNTAVEGAAKTCGYNSARGLGDIQTRFGCTGCPLAETIPPADPYLLKAPDEIDSTWTLADMQNTVTKAETNGGWVILTFHHICAGCDELSVTPTLFAQFTSWLKTHMASTPTTSVKTVSQVVGGTVKPPVTPPAPPAVSGSQTNASLETQTAGGPTCWTPYNYGTNAATFAPVSPGHTGARAEQVKITSYTDGAAHLLPTFDTGGCTPTVTPGRTYQLSAWYKANTVTQFVLYYRAANGGFVYWTSSPYFGAATAYTQATWVTPVVPAGATGLSFGLSLFSVGTLTTDDYGIVDTTTLPPPPPPATAMGNASLEMAGTGGLPQCWTSYGFGTNTATYAATTPGHTGSKAETVTISSYTSGDAKLLPTQDASSCAPTAVPGKSYTVGAWYKSSAVTQFALYYRTASGSWTYWTSGPWLAASAAWTPATFTTPVLPAGATAISFGLSLFSVGTLSTDDYSFAAVG